MTPGFGVYTVSRFVLFGLCLGVAGYAVVAYGLFPLGALVHPGMKESFLAHPAGVYAHVFGAAIALAAGPFQFSATLRRKRPALHRWAGRLYLTGGVLVGGLSGLYIAQFAFGGTISRTGFSALAVLWLLTGFMAYRAIRRRDVRAHRRWMVRNFSLTLAAVTLRLYIPLAFAAGIPFETAYPWIAWLCWAPNLAAAWWLGSSPAVARAPAGAGGR